MTRDITLELTVAEALIALGAIEDKQLDASRLAAISTGEEHEIADLSSKMLGSVARQIVDALYDEDAVRRIERVLDATEYPVDREGDPAFNGAFSKW